MEFKDVVLKRRMVRNFADKPVDAQVIKQIVDLTRHAPSAGFTQGQSFIVVTRPELKKAIADTCEEAEYVQSGYAPFISKAPVLLIPCASEAAYHRRYQEADKVNADGSEIVWPVPYWFMDIGCAVIIALLAAIDEGLVCAFAGSTESESSRWAIAPQTSLHLLSSADANSIRNTSITSPGDLRDILRSNLCYPCL